MLTEAGWAHLQAVAPGHVATVLDLVIDPLRADQITALQDIASSILARLENSHRSAQVG